MPEQNETPLMPHVNQRVTVSRDGHHPVPSRVEDETSGTFVIAAPNIALIDGEQIVVSWENAEGWYSLESTVMHVDEIGHLPTVKVVPSGKLSFHEERRNDARVEVELAIELRPVIARVIKPGRTLATHTVEIGGQALRFTTSAPFAPGDIVEALIELGAGEPALSTRLKIIRIDAANNSWRQVCTAAYDEMLRSDQLRLMSWIEARQRALRMIPLTAPELN